MGWDYKSNNAPLSQEFRDKYFVNIKGKEYVTVNGLLALAHEKGIKSLKTNIIQFPNKDNDMTCIVEATLIGYGWDPAQEKIVEVEYSGIGDANSKNVSNSQIAVHYIRMAETRAVGRVLRNYTNIGMTSLEEMGSVIEIPKITVVQINKIAKLMKEKSVDKAVAKEKCLELTGKADLREVSPDEADDIIKWLESL